MCGIVKKKILKRIYKKRDPWSKKYDFGHLLVIGGSKQYSGSPVFNALAALRAGVDLVTILAPERAANIIASFKPDLIAYPLNGNYITKKHFKELVEFTKKADAVVIGGGLGRRKETLDVVAKYLKKIKVPCVIDADAIHAVAKKRNIINSKPFVITPHAYEFFIFSGIKVKNKVEERVKFVKKVAEEFNVTILLKGHVDVISNGRKTMLNKTGSPELTVGGTGDTLAGIVGALLARGVDTFTAACAGAYINGKAGEYATKRYGESVIASDLIDEIPAVLKRL